MISGGAIFNFPIHHRYSNNLAKPMPNNYNYLISTASVAGDSFPKNIHVFVVMPKQQKSKFICLLHAK